MTLENISQNKVFNGWLKQYTHYSASLSCTMRFSIFLPSSANSSDPVAVLYWLSGLTCSDENFMHKAGAFRAAEELGIAIVAMDTSPRGADVADSDGYDLGKGAGFYLNATQAPWSSHYHMYDYVTKELPHIIENNFPVSDIKSIAGHSMGGHGALTIGLNNPEQYRSISAFSPVSNPMQCPWGEKAFNAYLGNDLESWKQYDTCELLKKTKVKLPILVDQGDADNFMREQLKPDALLAASAGYEGNIKIRMQPGYDHSYFFISTFIDQHISFHAKYLSV